MAELTVFYSWQSDIARRLSRDIIHRAATRAIERIKVDAAVEDSPRLDHDTQEVSGAPEIASTIFRKIDQCGIFLADLSFVGSTNPSDPNKRKKQIPNPNVLLELGYAVGKIGWDRVILVMNTAFGSPDELIFDLRHRRFPISFKFGTSDTRDAEVVCSALSEKIEEAIRASIQSEYSSVLDAIGQLNSFALQWLNEAGNRDFFSVNHPKTMGDILEFQQAGNGLTKLIELRILRCDVAHGGNIYAYHWTYLGKQVLKKLGIRPSAPTGLVLNPTANAGT